MSRNTLSLLFWGGLLLMPLPMLLVYFQDLWGIQHYQYFPVLFIAFGMLIALNWDRVLRFPASLSAYSLLGSGTLLSILASLAGSPWLCAVGYSLVWGGMLASQRSNTSSQEESLIFLWPLTWMWIRLPMSFDSLLMEKLQETTSMVSTVLLDLIGIPHRLSGNVFHLPERSLFVEEACSGVQSLFSLLFCSVLLVVWQKRGFILLPLYMVAGVFWAGMMNVMRIVAIAAMLNWYGIDLSAGWQHELLGYICLSIAILLLASTDRLLRVIFFPIPVADEANARVNPIRNVWNWAFGDLAKSAMPEASPEMPVRHAVSAPSPFFRPLFVASLVCASTVVIIQGIWFTKRELSSTTQLITPTAGEIFFEVDESLLSDIDPNWKVERFERNRGSKDEQLGVNSDVWYGTCSGVPLRIAISQPYPRWHDLNICYQANGWQINDRKLKNYSISGLLNNDGNKPPATQREAAESYATSNWLSSDGMTGYLAFSGFDQSGSPLAPPDATLKNLFTNRLDSVLQTGVASRVIMLQIWVTTSLGLDAEQRRSVDLLLQRASARLSERLKARLKNSPPTT